jgi:hypothetical protein
LNLLKSCAAAAHSPEDLELVGGLLLIEISRVEVLSNTGFELFLLQTVFIAIYWKLTSSDAFTLKGQLWGSTRKFQDVESFLTIFEEGQNNPEVRIQLDLRNYFLLDFAYRYLPNREEHTQSFFNCPGSCPLACPRSVNFKVLREKFIKQCPGTFELCNDVLGKKWLRACLTWCKAALDGQSQRAGSLQITRLVTGDEGRADQIWIYWHLWTEWQIRKGNPGGLPFWDEDTERSSGITAPELLFELTGLALSFDPATLDIKRSRSQDPKTFVKKRYLKGLEILSKMEDKVLAESFLSQHVSPYQSSDNQEYLVSNWEAHAQTTTIVRPIPTDSYLSKQWIFSSVQGKRSPN